MANGGWYGTDEEWNRIEAPLKLLDPEFDRFAHKYGLQVTKNFKEWPERSVEWGKDIRCLIQLFLADETKLALNLWICASEDRGENRFWKQEMLRKEQHASEIMGELFDHLESAKCKLDHWSRHPEEMEFATKLGRT